MSDASRLAIVGATGAVGNELVTILEERRHPAASLRLLASPRSAGTTIDYGGSGLTVEALTEDSFAGVDVALFTAGAATARQLAPEATARGVTVVDNSSAFRMDPDVPLVIPEINGDLVVAAHAPSSLSAGRIIANPNCSAIILLTALDPIRRAFGIERLIVSTYQAASGAGAAAMRELREQSRSVLDGAAPAPEIFAEPCAFNVFSHDTAVDPQTGRNVEEQKVMDETRKIWQQPDLRMSVTCIRVPVMRAHAESINVTLQTPATEAAVREALAAGAGVEVVDERDANDFPTSLKASGRDAVLIGRIRPDASQQGAGESEARPGGAGEAEATAGGGRETEWRGFELFVAGDQLRKGAALNALQIADLLSRQSPGS